MKLLADEGIDRPIVVGLREDGHEVFYVAELDPGIADETVLGLSGEQDALLVTADKDFGELIFRQERARGGVVLLRLAGLSNQRKAEIVVRAIRNHGHEMKQAFSVVEPASLRIRKRD